MNEEDKIMKDKELFEKRMSTIDSVKMRLIEIAHELEEGGYKRKGKSLETIVENLERWQHTK